MASPTVVTPIADQSYQAGESVSLDVSGNITDADAGDSYTFSVTGLPSGTGFSINPTTGELSGTPTAEDAAASPLSVTVRITDGSAQVASSTFSLAVTANVPSTAAQEFYVDGTNGNDSQSGSETAPFFSFTRANQVADNASGHVDIFVVGGMTYRTNVHGVIRPQNSGADDDHRIRWKVKPGTGKVQISGPVGGNVNTAVIIDPGIRYISIIGSSRDSTDYFQVNGEVDWGVNVDKDEDPNPVSTVDRGCQYDGSDCVLDFDIVNTSAWDGITASSSSGPLVCRTNIDTVGTPFLPNGFDQAETFIIRSAARVLLDGGTNGRSSNHGGHSGGIVRGAGPGAIRGYDFNNDWSGYPTFSSTNPDGNRALNYTTRGSRYWRMYECVINRNGKPNDQAWQELCKLEGRDNAIYDSVLRNSHFHGHNIACAAWSEYAARGRVAHCVYENLRGPIAIMRQYTGADASTKAGSVLDDYIWKNVIVKRVSVGNPRSGFEDLVFHVTLTGTSLTWTDLLQIHGMTIEDPSRDLDSLYLSITGNGAPGKQTLQWYMDNYSANFSSISVVTDCGLSSAPTASTNITAPQIPTYYTLDSGDTTSRANGVDLTTATSAGSSSTSLPVADAGYFPDPQDGVPEFGMYADGFYVHIEGVGNVLYTAVNYVSNVITLASAQTWSNGAAINKKILSGSTPNRGLRY